MTYSEKKSTLLECHIVILENPFLLRDQYDGMKRALTWKLKDFDSGCAA